jgi:muramoyltetrapeptide carboxypeptidase LdcA involved in peptidoglycan recycling
LQLLALVIVSTIGGDDSIRMLPFLEYSVIRQNPKVFMGYSDSTVTHFAFLKAGVTSFYGPSFMAGFDENGGLLSYMAASVRQKLFRPHRPR